MPTPTEIATNLFDDQIASQISCSDSDGQRRIVQMFADVTDQAVEETQQGNMLALQFEEGMETSNKIQLVTFI
jgi:hypothetical protein